MRFLPSLFALLFPLWGWSQNLRLAFVGDIMLGTTYPKERLPENEGRKLFKDAAAVLLRADVAFGNLEGTLADTGKTVKKGEHAYAFRTPTRYAARLAEAGFDFLSLANNHTFDFGLPGLTSTCKALREQGIAFAGIQGKGKCAIAKRAGRRIGFCAFGHNAHTYRTQGWRQVRDILTNLRAECDLMVVSFHGGGEGKDYDRVPEGTETYLKEDRGDVRAFSRFCIDAGADVVYGHGPHVVRGIELYKQHVIAYSLGNFCTPFGINTQGVAGEAPVLEIVVDEAGRFVNGRIHAFRQHYGIGPQHDAAQSAIQHIRRVSLLDFPDSPLLIQEDGELVKK